MSHADAVLEGGIQVAVEEIGRFHDVHVGIDEPQAVLHRTLLGSKLIGERLAIVVGRTISPHPE
jgi:hypothetical protein